jgi:hypothetical protein
VIPTDMPVESELVVFSGGPLGGWGSFFAGTILAISEAVVGMATL